MKRAVSKALLLFGAAALSSMLVLGSGKITVHANVPPEADAESGSTTPPTSVDNNGTAKGNGTGDPLTPDGNGTEVDSVDDNGKYFYTFVTDAGNYFYVVVDETRQDKNVYVLSTVDEEELLTLCKKDDENAGESMMPVDTGSDPTTTKSSVDLFGTPGGNSSSGGSDNDGDGMPDSWDIDGDGITDAWDTNGDGKPDAFDTDGDGIPDVNLIGPGVVGYDTNGDGVIDAWDTNGDGIIDAYDSDGDGIPDKFGPEAAQSVNALGKKTTEKNDAEKSIFASVKDNSSNLFVILAIIAGLGAGYYFKFYKPKHGPIGSGSSMDFEDDPDYQDEEDDCYDYSENDIDYMESQEREVATESATEEANETSEEQEEVQDGDSVTAGVVGSDGSGKVMNIDEKREEAQRMAEQLKKQLGEQKEASNAVAEKQNEKIKYLEEENSNLKEKVTKTKGILTGSVVPEEEEDEEDPEDERVYEERASPEI